MFPMTLCVEVIIRVFFYTAEVVGMAVNNSPFLTRLTRAISFNVLVTRLLGSNKTNLKVTPLQTLVSRSFIFYFNKKKLSDIKSN